MKSDNVEKVYFLHIPKTGGVSIEHAISNIRQFSACPAYSWEDLFALKNIEDYNLFQGHLQYFCKDLIGNAFTFTILREPVERAISGFQHILRDKNHPSHPLTNAYPDLISALEVPKLRVHISNAMSLFLGLRPQFDRFKTQRAAIQHIMKNYDEKEVLHEAKSAILKMDFVGFTETLNSDQQKLAKLLNPSMVSSIQEEAQNQNPNRKTKTYRETLSDEAYEKLKNANNLDYELYEFALQTAKQKGWSQTTHHTNKEAAGI